MTHKKTILRTLAVTATVLSIAATPAWAAWTYIGPGARSVYLTLPTVARGPVIPHAAPSTRKSASLNRLQRQGRLSGVLVHNLDGWQPNHWTAAGHGSLQQAIRHLVPGHTLQVHAGVLLPTVSWSAGSASVALYQIARSAGVLLVVTHHAVDVFAG
ncbi:hypothetical protein [Acidithiobacillus thiooxidans]|jgi:hypothetical protein|uniref:hypothetical protein n=1 Tax=Acidithiobacillus thiooxidans TaxID=930 RepID=UPI001C07B15C|nr:hypothetical protein [Acidithiobacillus thiooxidans]MBU2843792.1 hypothetical protein [Acidithiobacillus thiooxidans]